MNRTKSVLKNVIVGVLGQFIVKILGFFSRTIFIQQLGIVYLGLNGLFSNILSLLSLAELGIGSAIIFSLYKPLADKNEVLIKSLINFYAKAYKIIGVTIFFIGLLIIPFFDLIIKDKPEISNLNLIYILFLSSTVLSYFFAHKRAIFTADQKNFINVIYDTIFNSIMVFFQIIILIFTSDFILYLIVQILCIFMSNLFISIKANQMYSYLKKRSNIKIPKLQLQEIKKNIYSMFMLKIGAVVVNGTDNLLISAYIGITSVGIYSNYLMIISILQSIITQIFTSLTASVGNLVSEESKKKSLEVFYKILYMNNFIYGYICINLFIFLNPFINLWIGSEYTFPNEVVLLIVMNIYIMGVRRTNWVYINALGLFYKFRYTPFLEASINLIASIYFIKLLGISGVFIGTALSTIITYFIFEPLVIYRNYFKDRLYPYFFKFLKYLISSIIAGILIQYISSIMNLESWINIFILLIFSSILFTSIFTLLSFKTQEFKYYFAFLKKFVVKRAL